MNIRKIHVIAKDLKNTAVMRLIPNKEYKLEIVIENTQGKVYKDINLKDIEIIPENDELIEIRTSLDPSPEWLLLTKKQMAPFLSEKLYTLSINIQGNKYPTQIINWRVDWDNIDSFNYSGSSGYDGENGKDGKHKIINRKSDVVGGDAENGLDGENGKDGPQMRLYIFYYNTKNIHITDYDGSNILLLYSPEAQDMHLVKNNKNINLICTGGDGGNGGRGETEERRESLS